MLKLSEVLNRFNLSAQVFYAGDVCGTLAFEQASPLEGHMHLIKQGRLTLRTGDTSAYLIEQPSLVFMARSQPHQLRAQVEAGTQVVCASILYGVGNNNPLANAFPPVLVLPLDEDPRLAFVCTWLFDEAFAELEGRQLAINRLGNCWCCRCCVTWWSAPAYTPACWQALLTLSCTRPCWPYTETRRGLGAWWNWRTWPVCRAANSPNCSRLYWASRRGLFNRVAPGVAQSLLRQLKPVGLVAHEVGYENASVLARVFRKKKSA